MSGIEAVGLVLGLWPVLASLVNGYKASKDGDDRKAFLLHLEVQETIYRGWVRRLLQGEDGSLGEESSKAEGAQPYFDHSLWQTPFSRMRLRKRLGDQDFESMEYVLNKIESTMGILRNHLETGQADLILDGNRKSRMKSRLRQIRMNLPQSEFQTAFGKLKEYNTELQQLVQVFEEPRVAPAPGFGTPSIRLRGSPPRKTRRVAPRHITDFSQILDDSYHCNCTEGHVAIFCVNGNDEFQIYFGVEFDEPTRSCSEFSLQSRPTLKTDASAADIADVSGHFQPADDVAVCLAGTSERTEINKSPGQDDDRTSWSRSRHNSTSSGSQERRAARALPLLFCQAVFDPKINTQKIGDMCDLIKTLEKKVSSSQGPYQAVGTLGRGDHHFTARPMEAAVSMESKSVVCLDEKLPESEKWSLSRQKRVDIAQRLALAIVQFWPTPWIDKWWTWRDFSVQDNSPEMQLFVTRIIFTRTAVGKITGKPARIWRYLREPLLIRLGFALIELALGMRLSRLRDERRYGIANVEDLGEDGQDARDYDTAMTILERNILQEEISVAYQAVVEACLKCEVIQETGAISLTTAAESFPEDVDRAIVQPLCDYFETNWGDTKQA